MFEILKYIHENIEQSLTVAEISERFGYSRWHFCKKFREYAGTTFGDYVRSYRLGLAAIDILGGEPPSIAIMSPVISKPPMT